MARRFRHASAMRAWREFGQPQPNSVARARLLGEIFTLAAEPLSALEMLTRLSDRFDRPEELEAAVIFASIRLEPATPELTSELADRISESFATFAERFPDSTILRPIALDPDDPVSSLLATFGAQLEQRAQKTEELAAGVRGGVSAVALLASAAGRSLGETLFLLQALPLAFPDDQFERLDRVDAAAAYDAGAAVWDASAIFVVASLGSEIEGQLRNVLPASGIARATVQDAARDLLSFDNTERGEIAVVDGVLTFGTWSELTAPCKPSQSHRDPAPGGKAHSSTPRCRRERRQTASDRHQGRCAVRDPKLGGHARAGAPGRPRGVLGRPSGAPERERTGRQDVRHADANGRPGRSSRRHSR